MLFLQGLGLKKVRFRGLILSSVNSPFMNAVNFASLPVRMFCLKVILPDTVQGGDLVWSVLKSAARLWPPGTGRCPSRKRG